MEPQRCQSFLRLYTQEDREAILNLQLREVDQREIVKASGLTVRQNLELIVDENPQEDLYVIEHKGNIEGILGISPSPWGDNIGIPFLLITDIAEKELKYQFAKYSVGCLGLFHKKYDILSNYVAKENNKTIKWLKAIGAHIDEDKDFYLDDPYYPFKQFTFYKKKTNIREGED